MMLPRLLFAPWIPLWALAALALAGLALTVLAARGRGWAAWWRLLPLAVVLLALANPRLTQAQATDLDDVALVLVDESASMNVSGRHEQAEAALAGVVDQLKRLAGLEVRVERYRPAPGRDEGTQLFHALDRALADVPRSRLAGTIMITDGEVHDVPAKLGCERAAARADRRAQERARPALGDRPGARLRHRRQYGGAFVPCRGSRLRRWRRR